MIFAAERMDLRPETGEITAHGSAGNIAYAQSSGKVTEEHHRAGIA